MINTADRPLATEQQHPDRRLDRVKRQKYTELLSPPQLTEGESLINAFHKVCDGYYPTVLDKDIVPGVD